MAALVDLDDETARIAAILQEVFQKGRMLGDQEAIQRVIFAAQGFTKGPNNEGAAALQPTVQTHVSAEEMKTPARKYPYGFIKRTAKQVIDDNPGVKFNGVKVVAHAISGVEIDDNSLRNTIKDMLKSRQIHTKDGGYFPGPQAAQEETVAHTRHGPETR